MAATESNRRTKGSRIVGDHRTRLAEELQQRYVGGESIRSIAEEVGRSYGFVQGLLKESGVSLRGRGGDTRGRGGVRPGAGATAEEH
jgi:transposase